MKKSSKNLKFFKKTSRKKLVACLLSLTMLPFSGLPVIASEKKATTSSTTKSITNNTSVTFDSDSLTQTLGIFTSFYFFNGVDSEDIYSVNFHCDDNSILEIDSIGIEGPDNLGYDIIAKKTGSTYVSAEITLKNGNTVSVPSTKFTVIKSDKIAPIVDERLFYALRDILGSNNNYISSNNLATLKSIDLSNSSIEDLSGLQFATNCESLNLSNNSSLSDISTLKDMTSLKKINLSDTSVSDISYLNPLKDNLISLNLSGTKVSTADRFSMIQEKDIEIEADNITSNVIYPKNILSDSDTVTSSDSSILKITKENGEWLFSASSENINKEVTITVKNGTESKRITATIVKNEENLTSFKQSEINTNIGCFDKIDFTSPNVNVKLKSSNPEILNTITEPIYKNNKKTDYYDYYLEPQAKGDAIITATFTKDNGTTYKKTLTVHVDPVKDGVVPIKSYKAYKALRHDSSNSIITYKDLSDTTYCYLYDCDLSNDDINWISQITNCTYLDLSSNSKLSNVNQLSKLKNLKQLYLSSTGLTSTNGLQDLAKQLSILDLSDTSISDADRLNLITTDEISVTENTEKVNAVLPSRIIGFSDSFTIDNPDIATVSRNDYNQICIKAKDGTAGQSTKLIIQNSDKTVTKEIPIHITKDSTDKPGFASKEINATVGRFDKIEFKNIDNVDIKNISFEVLGQNRQNLNIAYDQDDNDKRIYRLEPQAEGTVTLKATFVKDDNTTYTDTATVTMSKDSNIVPFKSFNLYNGLYKEVIDGDTDNELTSVDSNKDYAISTSELQTVTHIGCYHTTIDPDDLSLLKQAQNCVSINFWGCPIDNIDFAANMKKLTFVDLSETEVSDLTPLKGIKNQLNSLYLSNTFVSASERLSFLHDQEISISAGAKKEITIKPSGVINDDDDLTINNPNIKISRINKDYVDTDNDFLLDATKLNDAEPAVLSITAGSGSDKVVKNIPINITEKNKNTPRFSAESKSLNIGQFAKIDFQNLENVEEISFSESPGISKKIDVADVSEYDEDEDFEYDVYYFVPQSVGETVLTATFTMNDGTTYSSDIAITVNPAKSDKVVPITNFSMYENSYTKEGDHIDTNHDLSITTDEFAKISSVNLSNATPSDLLLLSKATDCVDANISIYDNSNTTADISILSNLRKLERLSLSGYNIVDISFIKDLGNLTSLDIRRTNISDISTVKEIKDHFEYLYLPYDINVKDRFDCLQDQFILDSNDTVYLNSSTSPAGVLGWSNDYTITSSDPSIIEFSKDEDDDICLTPLTNEKGKSVNITISSEGYSKTIKVILSGDDENIPIRSISMNKETLSLNPGDTCL